MSLELYHGGPGANSLKVLLTMAEKGIDYVDHKLDLHNFEQHSPEFVKINPRGQVPALVHDGKVITESTVICEYLDAIFPNQVPLRPKDEYWRAQMRVWTKFVDEYFCWCVSTLGWEMLGKTVMRQMNEAEFEAHVAKVPTHEQQVKWHTARKGFPQDVLDEERRKIRYSVGKLEIDLSQRKWLAGDAYSLADICTYAIAVSVPRMQPDIMNDEDTPRAMEWLREVEARPAVAKTIASAPWRQPQPARAVNA